MSPYKPEGNLFLGVEILILSSSWSYHQQAHPSLSLSKFRSIGSWKSPANSSDSSCAKAFLAITGRWVSSCESIWWGEYTFERLFNVDSFLRTGLEIWYTSFRLTECQSSLMRNHSPVLLHIYLVSKDNLDFYEQLRHNAEEDSTHKGKALRITRTGLDQELVSPAVQCLEWFGIVHIVNEYTTICASVECNAQWLESFLTCSIP